MGFDRNTEEHAEPLERQRVRPPGVLCPYRVAVGNSPVPRRSGGSIQRPTPRRFGGGMSDIGSASGPRIACRFVLLQARCPRNCWSSAADAQAFLLFAEGDEEARSEDRASARKGLEQGEVGMVLGALRDGVVAVLDNVQGDTELASEGLHKQRMGGDDALISGQGGGSFDGVDALGNNVCRAHVVLAKKVAKVEQRASCTALRVGQRLRKSQNSSVSLS